MKIACISDIHGNAPALEAVLGDIDARGIRTILCAGDIVGFGPFPNEAIALLRGRSIPTVMGNYDAKVLKFPGKEQKYRKKKRPESYQSFKWTFEHLSHDNLRYLSSLPFSREETMDGITVLMAHGSMKSYKDYIPETISSRELAALLEGRVPELFITGHTHVPFFIKRGALHVAGCGSAGKPVEGSPDVSYVIVDLEGGPSGSIVRVSYDVERLCAAIIDGGLPAVFADQFRRGTGH